MIGHRCRAARPEPFDQLDAVDVSEVYVHEQNVGCQLFRALEPFKTRRSLDDPSWPRSSSSSRTM